MRQLTAPRPETRPLTRAERSLSYVEAAAIPEAFITAHDALVTQAALRPSETVLIHAVASGVGLAAVQLTRALGAIPFGTARGAGKRHFGSVHHFETIPIPAGNDAFTIRMECVVAEPAKSPSGCRPWRSVRTP